MTLVLPSQGWWEFGQGVCEGFALTAVAIIIMMMSVGDVFITTPHVFGRRAGISTPVPRNRPGRNLPVSLCPCPPILLEQEAWRPDCTWGEGRGTLHSLLLASLQREDLFISSS